MRNESCRLARVCTSQSRQANLTVRSDSVLVSPSTGIQEAAVGTLQDGLAHTGIGAPHLRRYRDAMA